MHICDRPRENQPSSHLGMTVEIPVLKVVIMYNQLLLVLGWLYLVKLYLLIYWIWYSVVQLRICYLFDFRPFQVIFWRYAPILGQRSWGGGWAGGVGGGWGGRWQQLGKNCPEKLHSEDTDTRAVHIVSHEAQWTQPWPRVQSQVDVIHLMCSTGTIVSNPHLHTVKSCPEKSRPIKYGHHMHMQCNSSYYT